MVCATVCCHAWTESSLIEIQPLWLGTWLGFFPLQLFIWPSWTVRTHLCWVRWHRRRPRICAGSWLWWVGCPSGWRASQCASFYRNRTRSRRWALTKEVTDIGQNTTQFSSDLQIWRGFKVVLEQNTRRGAIERENVIPSCHCWFAGLMLEVYESSVQRRPLDHVCCGSKVG